MRINGARSVAISRGTYGRVPSRLVSKNNFRDAEQSAEKEEEDREAVQMARCIQGRRLTFPRTDVLTFPHMYEDSREERNNKITKILNILSFDNNLERQIEENLNILFIYLINCYVMHTRTHTTAYVTRIFLYIKYNFV